MENKTSTQEVYIDGIHDYNYVLTQTEKETAHALYYSDSDEWSGSTKNSLAVEIIDTGNGVTMKHLTFDDDDVKEDGYCYLKVEQLHILLRLFATPSVYEISQPIIKTKF